MCGGPGRSAKEPQTPNKISARQNTTGGKSVKGNQKTSTRPTIITIDGSGLVRRWGLLSRENALRAGCYWEDMDRTAKVYLEKDQKRTEVLVEMIVRGGRPRYWFKEKKTQNQEEGQQETQDDESVTEDDPITEDSGMQEVSPEERQSEQLDGLAEKVASLEKENCELKKAVQEMEAKTSLQAQAIMATAERCSVMENAIMKIAQHVQQQEVFNGSVKTSIDSLESQVRTHQDNFQEVVRIFQNHEKYIVRNGAVADEMAQYINALIEDAEKKRLWIGNLMKESQAQEEVLKQHHMGQQVLAEVMKRFVFQQEQQQPQPQQGQAIAGAGPIVTEVDDDDDPDRLNFLTGPNPHKGPPNGGTGQTTTKPPRTRKLKTTLKRK